MQNRILIEVLVMKIAMAQITVSDDLELNYQKTLKYIEKSKDCDLLFFPEIQWSPFFPQYRKSQFNKDISEYILSVDNEKIQSIMQKSKEYSLCISPNLYIEENSKLYDMSLMIDSFGNMLGKSKMVHIMQSENFYEQDYYTPSDDGFKVYDTPFGKVGIVICFDRHLPESIRTCALMGAELIIIPTANVKGEPLEMFEWEVRTQAYQNNVFIAMCNRVGKEGNMDFAGQSLVVDCDGNLLFKADDREQLVVCNIDLSLCQKSRQNRPYINLRRKEMYL
jgi:N-carbamoylputrescine amidase